MAKSVYDETYQRSMKDPAAFWAAAAEDIYWDKRWDRVFDDSRKPFSRWFTGGELNTCYNAVDVHVDRGRGKQKALVYDSPVTGTVKAYTYRELRDAVALCAGMLRRQGIEKGDRVIIYMPMVPEAVIAMLACARIGAIHSVVFGGFASNELAKRIDDSQPKLILSGSCGIEVNRVIPYKALLDGAIDLARHKVPRCVILQRPQETASMVRGRDRDWNEEIAASSPAECVPVAATDPLYILYTSGTTGIPKGVVRDNGGHAVALKWSMDAVYGMGAGETFWAASDIGWVVGHSYIVYAPLLKGCTTILYEGKPVGTPDPGAFWRLSAQHGVHGLPRHQEGGPAGDAHRQARSLALPDALPRRRALRPGHAALGRGVPPGAGHRPLVADRDGLAHRGQLHGARPAAREAGLAHQSGAGLRRARARRGEQGAAAGSDRLDRDPAAHAA